MNLISNGSDPWQTGETPNDRLLKLARSVQEGRMSGNNRLKKLVGKRTSR